MHWNDLIGASIGSYHILDELGRGGSSRVFRALQDAPRRQVAIKIMVNDADDPLGYVRRFEREVEVVAHLNHPNVVAVYDSGQYQDLIYLVMRYVNGGTLRQQFGQPLSVNDACAAMIQMGHALHHAHLHGIVHRDVKPSNMLVAADAGGQLLLTDFGIAKLRGMRGLTKSGTTIGTPEYMAPEQAEGREVDPRADVYSLGCVLYEALAGRPPFIGTTPVSVLYQQVHARPNYIRGLNPAVPRDLARVIEIALAKRPDDRFVSALSFAQALEPYVSHAARFATPIPAAARHASAEQRDAAAQPLHRADAAAQVFGKRVYADDPGAMPAEHKPTFTVPATDWSASGLDDLFPEQVTLPLATGSSPQAASADDSARNVLPSQEFGAPAPLPDARRAPVSGPVSGPRPTIPLPPVRASRATPTKPRVERPHRESEGLPAPLTGADAPTPPIAIEAQPDGVDIPPAQAGHPPGSRRGSGRGRPPMPRHTDGRRGGLIGVVLLGLIAVVVLAGVLAGGNLVAGLARRPSASVTPTAMPTVAASPTASAQPAATASPTQQLVDQQAAAAFRAITLSSITDNACASANNKIDFDASEYIYVNVCLANTAAYGHMTILLRQNETTTFVITRDYQVTPGVSYWFRIFTYGDGPGRYDVLVTYNGGTAADPPLSLH